MDTFKLSLFYVKTFHRDLIEAFQWNDMKVNRPLQPNLL